MHLLCARLMESFFADFIRPRVVKLRTNAGDMTAPDQNRQIVKIAGLRGFFNEAELSRPRSTPTAPHRGDDFAKRAPREHWS
jgi:hypothetical protein